jgi:hypothetical protein
MEQLDIVNLALNHLGMRSLSNLTGSDPSTTAANVYWEPCRDDVLRESSWPFANVVEALDMVTTTLSWSVTDNIPDWSYAYEYPANAMNIWNVFDEATIDNKQEQNYQVRYDPTLGEKIILSDLYDPWGEYTYKITEPSKWDSKFVMAFSYRLAATMAHQLTGDASLGLKMMDLYNVILSEAKRLGHSEKVKKPPQSSSTANSRG